MNTPSPITDKHILQLHAIEQRIRKGELEQAAKDLNAIQKNVKNDPRIFLLGARLAHATGHVKGAVESARRAVNLAPEWGIAAAELAFALARQNQFIEAIQHAERAVSLQGESFEVLSHVVDVAHRAQHLELAVQWLRKLAELDPRNGNIQLMLARDLVALDEHAQAVQIYDALIKDNPKNSPALLGRLQAALALDNKEQALKDSDALLEINPDSEEALFWRQIAYGETPATQPISLVRQLNEGFADLYDQHMVRTLKYQLPRQVAEHITARYPDKKMNVLDLGCGTGLLGVCLGRIDGALVGVDVSIPMIEQAARHNVYDRFHTVNLLDALVATPDNLYNVITACDVFIYVGDLSKAIPNAFRILTAGGHFIFSCESATADEGNLTLRPSMRYAHQQAHIEALCKAAGFDDISVETTDLRLENNQPVAGFVVIARKPV